MGYNHYQAGKPDGAIDSIIEVPEHVRRNQAAFIDAINSGGAYAGVDQVYEGPDPEYPLRVIYQGPVIWIKKNITWGPDYNPTSLLYERSANGGQNWSLIGTKTLVYDSNGFVIGTLWEVAVGYTAFDPTKPDAIVERGPEITPSIRANQDALADAIVMESMPGWELSMPGQDPVLPEVVLETNKADPNQILRTETVYNPDTTPQTITYSRTNDGGSVWNVIGTKTVTYDGNGNPIAVNWS